MLELEEDILAPELIEPLLPPDELEDDIFDRDPDELRLLPKTRALDATSPLEESSSSGQ